MIYRQQRPDGRRLTPEIVPGQKSSGKSNIRGTESGNVVPGVFTRVLAAGEVLENGFLLGLFPEGTYSAVQLTVEPGDRCVLYTDGIPETRNPSQEVFGVDRFKRFLETYQSFGADQFADSLLDELSRWSGQPKGQGQDDDITLLAIHFKTDK